MSFPLKNILQDMATAFKAMSPEDQEQFRKESLEFSRKDLGETEQTMGQLRGKRAKVAVSR